MVSADCKYCDGRGFTEVCAGKNCTRLYCVMCSSSEIEVEWDDCERIERACDDAWEKNR